jgi:hypothetical protein
MVADPKRFIKPGTAIDRYRTGDGRKLTEINVHCSAPPERAGHTA